MIAMELGNGLRIRIRNGLGNGVSTVGYCCGNGIGMQIHSLGMFERDPPCVIGSCSLLFTDLFETDVIAVLEDCCTDWKYGYHHAKVDDVTCMFCS
jgi:hypothetical protein